MQNIIKQQNTKHKYKKEPSERHKVVWQKIFENLRKGLSMGDAMRQAGYSDSYAHNPNQLRETKSWRALANQLQNLLKKSRITRRIRLHDLRHTFGTLYMANGCPPDYIALFTGHSDVRTTRKYYLAVKEKHAKEAHTRFNPFAGLNNSVAITSQLTPLSAHSN